MGHPDSKVEDGRWDRTPGATGDSTLTLGRQAEISRVLGTNSSASKLLKPVQNEELERLCEALGSLIHPTTVALGVKFQHTKLGGTSKTLQHLSVLF